MNRNRLKFYAWVMGACLVLTACAGNPAEKQNTGSNTSSTSRNTYGTSTGNTSITGTTQSSTGFTDITTGTQSEPKTGSPVSSNTKNTSTAASGTVTKPGSNIHKIRNIKLNADRVSRYECIEATFEFEKNYENPFDSSQIRVDAIVNTPNGETITIPCFVDKAMSDASTMKWTSYYDKYAFIKREDEVWKMRFSYNQTGKYTWKIVVTDSKGTSQMSGQDFYIQSGVTKNTMWEKGPVEIAPNNRGYFRYKDTHKDYVPVGYALPWSWPEDISNYKSNIKNLSSSGGNITRVWGGGIPQTLELENNITGVGVYQINHANIQDKIFRLLRDSNVTVQYSFDSFTSLQSDKRWYGEWDRNPYNTQNGGFLSTPSQFFTNDKAKKCFKDRLRYSLARWGWDVNITLFELWNEIDGVNSFHGNIIGISKWIDEMCKYIKSMDPYKRPISISYANSGGYYAIDNQTSIDFLTTHFYGSQDMPEGMKNYVGNLINNYNKPVIVGEFGPYAEDFGKCYNGIYLQEGIWASIAAGSAMSAQSWWWEEVINKQGAYQRLSSLRNFVDDFEFSKEALYSLSVTSSHSLVRGYGQANSDGTRGFLWIQNKDNGWYEIYKNGRNGTLSSPIHNVTVSVPVKNGTYLVKRWNTWDASVKPQTQTIQASNGKLTISVGSLQQDTAYSFILK